MASAKSLKTAPKSGSAKPPERFGLTGPSIKLDRRINAIRGDIADIALAGVLFAPHYAKPVPMSCLVPHAPIRAGAADGSALISELLYGETFQVLDISGGWAWGFGKADHYVGYVPAEMLGAHRTGELRVSVPLATTSLGAKLPMGALIDGNRVHDRIETPLGAIAADSVETPDADPVAVAERFLETPYLLGGRTAEGIDCSGLVQLAFAMTGRALPRDSDLQPEAAGRPLEPGAPLQRGDLVFFPGHVGLMVDEMRLIHATGHHGKTLIEPLAIVEQRTDTAKAYRP